MKFYQILFANGLMLEIDLESMYLTPEMTQEIIQDNAPEEAHVSWELHEQDTDGAWFFKFDSSEQ